MCSAHVKRNIRKKREKKKKRAGVRIYGGKEKENKTTSLLVGIRIIIWMTSGHV